MAADPLAHAPLFTEEETARLRSGFLRSIVPPEEADWMTVSIFGWATTCWQCGIESYVWMDLDLTGPTVTSDCERPDVRRALALTNPTPHALIGMVTTKAGGTYRGFTCPWCRAVHGKHFLKVELFRRLLDDETSVDKHHFDDASYETVPALVLTELKGTAFPETRARQFKEWRASMDNVITYRRKHGKYPTKREDDTIHKARLNAREGILTPERRAYLDVHLPDWLPDTVPVPRAYIDRADAIAIHRDAHGAFPLQGSKDTTERRLASWLLSQRIRFALGKMKEWQRQALNDHIPGWDTVAVPDWFSSVLRVAAEGLGTTDPELVAFLDSERARFLARSVADDDHIQVLDRYIPGWEEGLAFREWMAREARYCRAEMDAGADWGHDMIHDVQDDPRCRVFFDRLRNRHRGGRLSTEEFEELFATFETLNAYLGVDGYSDRVRGWRR